MTDDPQTLVRDLAARAKAASRVLATAPVEAVNAALRNLAARLRADAPDILAVNAHDVAAARARGQTEALIDRMTLTPARVEAMAQGAEVVADLPDPVGQILWETTRPNGLSIQRVSVPIGVLGMVYESRPNVTIDAAALALKSRNAIVLRGGAEALRTSLALHARAQDAVQRAGLPAEAVAMIPVPARDAVGALLAAGDLVDLMIPRGGRGLIERVQREAAMPVLAHLDGVCHVYIDASADPDMARRIAVNAKMQRTGVCNAAETLLLDAALDPDTARGILAALREAGCEVVGDAATRALDPAVSPATDDDWATEYLAPKISVALVDGVDGAAAHIARYGSGHTEAIVAQDARAAEAFLAQVDAGSVLHNASTRFADGFEYGLGAEIGIATGRLHARGPVGAQGLTTYKYIVRGAGQIRE
jgi:glutamate-5-semialdehyde dehydrogenase